MMLRALIKGTVRPRSYQIKQRARIKGTVRRSSYRMKQPARIKGTVHRRCNVITGAMKLVFPQPVK